LPLSPLAAGVLAVSVAARQPVAAPSELHEALVVAPVGSAQRTVIAADPVALALVRGTWTAPKAGDALAGDRKWAAAAIEDGKLACRGGGYAFVPFAAVEAGVLILQASGHGMVYVNGQPRAGDPYETGYCRIPIRVNQGENWLLFRTSRPELRIAIARPPAPVYIDTGDPTLPDLARDESGIQLGAAVVVNATEEWVQDLRSRRRCRAGRRAERRSQRCRRSRSRRWGSSSRPGR
jgi:hypothetical protein